MNVNARKYLDWVLLLVVNFMWATQAPVVKLIGDRLGPVAIAFLPMILSTLLFLPVLWLGALAAVAAHLASACIGDVGAVELADAVIRESGPAAYGPRARLVADEPQCEVEPQPVARVSIVGNAHECRLDPVSWYW